MKTLQVDVYSFDELSAKAKAFAVQSNSDINTPHGWWQLTYQWFQELLHQVGITVETRNIHFSGFYAQGDGAGFAGELDLLKMIDAVERQHWTEMLAPSDSIRLMPCPADRRVIRLLRTHCIDAMVVVKMSRRVGNVIPVIDFLFRIGKRSDYKNIGGELARIERWTEEVLKALNQFLYDSLRNEYEYLTAETVIAEALVTQEQWFMRDGRSADWLQHYDA